jgi:hypothetical protein
VQLITKEEVQIMSLKSKTDLIHTELKNLTEKQIQEIVREEINRSREELTKSIAEIFVSEIRKRQDIILEKALKRVESEVLTAKVE